MKQITTYITEKSSFLTKKHVTIDIDTDDIPFVEPKTLEDVKNVDAGSWLLIKNTQTDNYIVTQISKCSVEGAGTQQSPKYFCWDCTYSITMPNNTDTSIYAGEIQDRLIYDYIKPVKWTDEYKDFVRQLLNKVNAEKVANIKKDARIGRVLTSLDIQINDIFSK